MTACLWHDYNNDKNNRNKAVKKGVEDSEFD